MAAKLKRVYFEVLLVLAGYFLYTSSIKITDVVIRSDGKGYYDYLPAATIYHDLNFGFRSKPVEIGEANTNHNVECNGKIINKYPCGLSLLWAPFFAVTHQWVKSSGHAPANGYSMPYHFSVALAALVYLLIGLIYLRKLLLLFTPKLFLVRWVQLAFLLGTNLYVFAYFDPAFGHVYSFGLITVFIYAFVQWQRSLKNKYLFAVAVLLGLIVLIRPFNILVLLFLPFLCGGIKHFLDFVRQAFQQQGKMVFVALFLFLTIVSIQPIVWYLQCGRILPWTYSRETFHFTQPALWQTLFGFKKGLFIYTPLLWLSLLSIPFLFRQKKTALALSLLVAIVVLHYIVSSWQTWWYGGSLGLRPWIDFYSIWAVMLVMVLMQVGRMAQWVAGVFTVLCIGLNLFQTWQYTHGIIPGESMTREGYMAVFLKTDEKYAGWLDYKNICREKEQLRVMDATIILDRPVTLEPGEWKNITSVRSDYIANQTQLYDLVLSITPSEKENPVVYLQLADTLGEIFHYDQRPLFHLTGEKKGRQLVHFYFEVTAPGEKTAVFTCGFLSLKHTVAVHAAMLNKLESPTGSRK